MKTQNVMSDKRRTSLTAPLVLVLLALAGAGFGSLTTSAAQRSIAEFIEAQQAYGDYGTIYWLDLEGKWVFMDYANLAGSWYGLNLGTTMEGTVNERPLPDGRAEVSVVLHTRNAVTVALYPYSWMLFGYSLDEYWMYKWWYGWEAPLAIGDCQMQVKFINSAPGAPLPNVTFLSPPDLLFLAFRGSANGVLREGFGALAGSPGHLEVTQVGLYRVAAIANPNSRVAYDAFPAEHIVIRPVGR